MRHSNKKQQKLKMLFSSLNSQSSRSQRCFIYVAKHFYPAIQSCMGSFGELANLKITDKHPSQVLKLKCKMQRLAAVD